MPVGNVTFVTQEQYIQKKGKKVYPLPKNPSSISFRAPGQDHDGVIADALCDRSKMEDAEELVLVDHEKATINIRFRPSVRVCFVHIIYYLH